MADTEPAAEPTVTVREWLDVVRRARLGRTTKAVAFAIASYADFSNGRRVHPGIGRLAVDCEITYKIAQQHLAKLREAGLIKLVRRGQHRGRADEYRLVLAADLLDRLDVLTPAQLAAEVERLAEKHRGRRRPAATHSDAVHPTARGAQDVDGEAVHPTGKGAQDVNEHPVHPTGRGAQTGPDDDRAPHGEGRTGGCAPHGDAPVHPTPCPTTSHIPTTTPTSQSRVPVGGDHQTARAADTADEPTSTSSDQTPAPLPDHCPHGLSARRRPDGTSSCALCRREARTTTDPARPTLRLIREGVA